VSWVRDDTLGNCSFSAAAVIQPAGASFTRAAGGQVAAGSKGRAFPRDKALPVSCVTPLLVRPTLF